MKTFFVKILLSFLLLSSLTFKAQSSLVRLSDEPTEFTYEMYYATSNNFLGKPLYPCSQCILQKDVARALSEANYYFCTLGYRIVIYDCYRPLDIQKTMWQELPNPNYIANPYEAGSIHNRAAAVDLSLESLEGCYVDMGSDYDHFGPSSHIDYTELPTEVLVNRKLLLEGMQKFGFQPIRTEWWHFSFYKCYEYPILNEQLPCNN